MNNAKFILFLLTMVHTEAPAEQGSADAVLETAKVYFESLMSGVLSRTNEVVDVPFSFDRKKVIKDMAELKAIHKAIIVDKGKRDVPKYVTGWPKDFVKLDSKEFKGKYEVIRFTLLEGKYKGERIDVYLKSSKGVHKVIGFSD